MDGRFGYVNKIHIQETKVLERNPKLVVDRAQIKPPDVGVRNESSESRVEDGQVIDVL